MNDNILLKIKMSDDLDEVKGIADSLYRLLKKAQDEMNWRDSVCVDQALDQLSYSSYLP